MSDLRSDSLISTGLLKPAEFVGREAELQSLFAAVDETSAGRGGVFLVGGEPGIGKSRLADELARYAQERDAQALWGRCWEFGGAPAYWPWVQSIRGYSRTLQPAVLRAHIEVGAPFLAQILPELLDVLPETPALPSLDSEGARFQLFDAVATFFRKAAKERPLVFILDDLHVADAPSLFLLRFLASELAGSRILVLGLYRQTELGRDHPLAATLAEAGRSPATRRLLLTGLGEKEVRSYIESITGTSPAVTVVRAIHEATEGNPLFLREVVQLLLHERRLQHAGEQFWWKLNIPPGVRQVIGRRIAHLSENCNRILTLASVLGREFDLDTLERLSGDTRDILWETLDEAVAARVVSEVPGALGRLRFDHALIREVFYHELTPSRRVRLHLKAGEALESLYAEDAKPHLAELAHHFFAAALDGGAEKAVRYARAAGDAAAELLAFEEAARLYGMALQILLLKKEPESELKCELLLVLGDVQMRGSDTPGGRASFLAAADLARALNSRERMGISALGYGGRFVWSRGASDPRLIPLLREALNGLGQVDTRLRGRLLARLAGALRDETAGEERHALSKEAVEIARRLGDPETLAYTLDGRFAALWEPGNTEERLAIARELVRVAEAAGDKERVVQGHHYCLIGHFELGDLVAARMALAEKTRVAEELRQPAQRWYVAVMDAMLALFDGDMREAETLVHRAQGLHPHSWSANGSYRSQLFVLRREQVRLAEIEELIRRSAEEYAVFPVFRAMLAVLYAELGREEEARATFDAVAVNNFGDLPWDCEWLYGVALLADVACALGDLPRASILYRLLSPYARFNIVAPAEVSAGSASRYLGVLATALSQWDEAARHFEAALTHNRAMGARSWVAHTEHDYARMLLRRRGEGDQEHARDLLLAALAAARELELSALEKKAEQLLAEESPDIVAEPAAVTDLRPDPISPYVFRCEGEFWTMVFQSEGSRLKNTKGLHYLARLLSEPSSEVHSLELIAGLSDRPQPDSGKFLDATTGRASVAFADGGAVLDPQAKAAYRDRIAELNGEIEEATAWGDLGRAERASEEREFILHELAAAVGLAGRDRKAASAAERARVSATRAIKSALKRIREHSPELGEHLDATVRTGTFCSYTPDPRVPIHWDL